MRRPLADRARPQRRALRVVASAEDCHGGGEFHFPRGFRREGADAVNRAHQRRQLAQVEADDAEQDAVPVLLPQVEGVRTRARPFGHPPPGSAELQVAIDVEHVLHGAIHVRPVAHKPFELRHAVLAANLDADD